MSRCEPTRSARRLRISAIQSAKNIADPVDVYLQTDLTHLVNEKLATTQLFNEKTNLVTEP
mgnify:CR=1 FL=1